MSGGLKERLKPLLARFLGDASPAYETAAKDFVAALRANNGFSLWAADQPENWESAADLRWSAGVQWTEGDRIQLMTGFNLCQMGKD